MLLKGGMSVMTIEERRAKCLKNSSEEGTLGILQEQVTILKNPLRFEKNLCPYFGQKMCDLYN